MAARRAPGLDHQPVARLIEARDDDLFDVDPKRISVAVGRNLDRPSGNLCLATPGTSLRRVMRRAVNRDTRIAK